MNVIATAIVLRVLLHEYYCCYIAITLRVNIAIAPAWILLLLLHEYFYCCCYCTDSAAAQMLLKLQECYYCCCMNVIVAAAAITLRATLHEDYILLPPLLPLLLKHVPNIY